MAAFQRDSLPGMVCVEAYRAKTSHPSCGWLVGVYISRGIRLVSSKEMASFLQIKKQEQTVTPGTRVHIRRGKYAGDFAQVVDITKSGEDVGLRFIPRIDLTLRGNVGKKRKKSNDRYGYYAPPAKTVQIRRDDQSVRPQTHIKTQVTQPSLRLLERYLPR